MLDKLKNIFKDKNSKEWQEQVEWAKNQVSIEEVTETIDLTEEFYGDINQIEPTPEMSAEIISEYEESAPEDDYLKYSPQVIGYPDQELQTNIYRGISYYIGTDSILDYGCGRGDFKIFLNAETSETNIDYVGIDSNAPLIDAGKSVYGDAVDIRLINWSEPHDIVKDWAVNITGLNLRYDADMTKDDMQYFEYVIDIMMQHATKGVVVMLSSSMYEHEPGIIRYNPGDVLNKMQQKYGACLIDHSIGNLAFALVIYKS